jgi:hypothetical protein
MTNDNEPPALSRKGLARKRHPPRDAEGRVFKGLPRIHWAEDADEQQELIAARNSPYYWWWAFLRESREYRRALSGRTDEPYAGMARHFGRLGDDFDRWWLRTGREIFAEQMSLPRVRMLEHGVTVNLDQINPKLVLEVPLTIRRSTILRQVNRLLDEHHQGAKLRVMKHGSATRKLYPDSRMRLPTLKVLYDVWMEKKQNPELEWHVIGEKLGLSPVFLPAERDDEKEIKYKSRCMTIVIQRYHRKAAALIDFAARGDFPRLK